MAINTRDLEIKLIQRSTGVELDLGSLQGLWTEAQYLKLTDQSNLLFEFTDGYIEALPMPTDKHQVFVQFLFLALYSFMQQLGGKVLFAPLRLQVRAGKQREPDILLMLDAHDPRRQNRYWLGADLVVEVVSEDDPERDTVEKVADYAEAGISEYWIVNPLNETITVLTLADDIYATHGLFRRGEYVTSRLLADFETSVDAVFDAH